MPFITPPNSQGHAPRRTLFADDLFSKDDDEPAVVPPALVSGLCPETELEVTAEGSSGEVHGQVEPAAAADPKDDEKLQTIDTYDCFEVTHKKKHFDPFNTSSIHFLVITKLTLLADVVCESICKIDKFMILQCAFDRVPYALYRTWGGHKIVSHVFGRERWLLYNEFENQGYMVCAFVLRENMNASTMFQFIADEMQLPRNHFFKGLVINYPLLCMNIQNHCSHYVCCNMNHTHRSRRLNLKISFRKESKLTQMSPDLLATTSMSSISLAHCASQSQATPVKVVKVATPPPSSSNKFICEQIDLFITASVGQYLHICVSERTVRVLSRYIRKAYGQAVYKISRCHPFCFSNYFPSKFPILIIHKNWTFEELPSSYIDLLLSLSCVFPVSQQTAHITEDIDLTAVHLILLEACSHTEDDLNLRCDNVDDTLEDIPIRSTVVRAACSGQTNPIYRYPVVSPAHYCRYFCAALDVLFVPLQDSDD